ncbi:MAG: transcriptional regulator, partial [Pseudorhizobium sp.]
MSVRHHISDELLLDYAAGNLSEGWSLAVATHLALCPTCRRQLEAMEGAAGALLDKISIEPAAADDDSWQRMRARLTTESLSQPQSKPQVRKTDRPAAVIP